jgi:hypothetical protein
MNDDDDDADADIYIYTSSSPGISPYPFSLRHQRTLKLAAWVIGLVLRSLNLGIY